MGIAVKRSHSGVRSKLDYGQLFTTSQSFIHGLILNLAVMSGELKSCVTGEIS